MWSVPAALAMAAVLLLGGPDVLAQKRGGVLRIGNLGEPPTLDAHWTTATLTEVLTNHLYEGLYALDEGYRPIPHARRGIADDLTRTASPMRSGSARASSSTTARR